MKIFKVANDFKQKIQEANSIEELQWIIQDIYSKGYFFSQQKKKIPLRTMLDILEKEKKSDFCLSNLSMIPNTLGLRNKFAILVIGNYLYSPKAYKREIKKANSFEELIEIIKYMYQAKDYIYGGGGVPMPQQKVYKWLKQIKMGQTVHVCISNDYGLFAKANQIIQSKHNAQDLSQSTIHQSSFKRTVAPGYRTLRYLRLYQPKVVIKSTEYPILTGEVNCAHLKSCVYVGINREGIWIDLNSVGLDRLYFDYLKTYYCVLNDMSLRGVLQSVLEFTADQLKKRRFSIETFSSDTIQTAHLIGHGQSEEDINVVPLECIVRQRQGVCRHHAALNIYLLRRLIKDYLIYDVNVHLYRNNVLGQVSGVHGVVVIVEPKKQKVHYLDSFNELKPYTMDMKQENWSVELSEIKHKFGAPYLQKIRSRFASS